jgi:hypothetical protein
MARIVAGTAVKVSSFEIEVTLFAYTAKLRVFGIELVISNP